MWATVAKLSALIPVSSEVLGLPEKTVAIYARHLRLARLLSTGGRGRGGADMTPTDCTNLLIAIMGSNFAKDAAKTVTKYRSLVVKDESSWQLDEMPLPSLIRLPRFHQFGAAMDGLFEAAMDGSLVSALENSYEEFRRTPDLAMQSIRLDVLSPNPVSDIEISGPGWSERNRYVRRSPYLRTPNPSPLAIKRWENRLEREGLRSDLNQVRFVTTKTILQLGGLLAHK